MNGSAQDAAGEVVHNRAAEQFELRIGDALCVLQYRRRDALLIIYHTEVPPPHEGRGMAARMTRAALEFARAENLRVEPRCPYTAAFLRKHREYLDLRLSESEARLRAEIAEVRTEIAAAKADLTRSIDGSSGRSDFRPSSSQAPSRH